MRSDHDRIAPTRRRTRVRGAGALSRRRTLLVSVAVGLGALVALRQCAAGHAPGGAGSHATRIPVPAEVLRAPATVATLRRVIDGDSLEVALATGVIEVRLSGIDAPEHGQPGGDASRDALAGRLPPRASVVLRPVTVDEYGRLVARVSIDGVELEPWLLREGHAWAYRRHVADPGDCHAEQAARVARRGLWAAPPGSWTAPWDWRRHARTTPSAPLRPTRVDLDECLAAVRRADSTRASRPAVGPATSAAPAAPGAAVRNAPSARCEIKGNVGARGDRIYHLPGTPGYAATRIEPARGERWFCSEQEARAAGWRPPH